MMASYVRDASELARLLPVRPWVIEAAIHCYKRASVSVFTGGYIAADRTMVGLVGRNRQLRSVIQLWNRVFISRPSGVL